MDKTKMSVAITASLLCTMLYANVTNTHANMRVQETDTIALAYISAAAVAPGTPTKQQARSHAATSIAVALPPVETNDERFVEYLKLHQSRVETPPPVPLKLAAWR